MSLGGIIASESMYLFPFVFLQVAGALERMDPTWRIGPHLRAGLGTITADNPSLVMPSILYRSPPGGPLIPSPTLACPRSWYRKGYLQHTHQNLRKDLRFGRLLRRHPGWNYSSTILVISAALILKLQDTCSRKVSIRS
jgi:hypothetical protein